MNNVTSQALTYAWSRFGHPLDLWKLIALLLLCLYILDLFHSTSQLAIHI